MRNEDIIRAWKDDAFRTSLSDEERALLPAHPVGPVELSDHHLGQVGAGSIAGCPTISCTVGPICTGILTVVLSCQVTFCSRCPLPL